MSNTARNGPESAKIVSVDDRPVHAPGVCESWNLLWDPKKMSNNTQNGLESAKIASVDDRHVNAPWGSSTVKITPGPQKCEE